MALRGELDVFALGDLLRVLASTGKSGCLHVDGDLGRGRLWMEGGRLLSVDAQRARPGAAPEEAVFELLRCEYGSFSFRSDEPVPATVTGPPLDLDLVLHGARRLLEEWVALQADVPSVDHHVVLRSALEADSVTIDSRAWTTLQAVGGGRSVAQVAGLLDVGEMEGVRRVRDLLTLGVASLVAPVGAPPPTARRRRPSDRYRPVTGATAPVTGSHATITNGS